MVRYRPFEPDDLGALAAIRAAEWGESDYWQRRISAYLSGAISPQQALAPRACYVAEDVAPDDGEGAIVGFAAGHLTKRYGCDGELQWINVAGDRQGERIGSGLLSAMAAWFISQGAYRICVDAEPDNSVARAFYQRTGATILNPHWLVWNDVRELSVPEAADGSSPRP